MCVRVGTGPGPAQMRWARIRNMVALSNRRAGNANAVLVIRALLLRWPPPPPTVRAVLRWKSNRSRSLTLCGLAKSVNDLLSYMRNICVYSNHTYTHSVRKHTLSGLMKIGHETCFPIVPKRAQNAPPPLQVTAQHLSRT